MFKVVERVVKFVLGSHSANIFSYSWDCRSSPRFAKSCSVGSSMTAFSENGGIWMTSTTLNWLEEEYLLNLKSVRFLIHTQVWDH
jgi:hypothetical protein